MASRRPVLTNDQPRTSGDRRKKLKKSSGSAGYQLDFGEEVLSAARACNLLGAQPGEECSSLRQFFGRWVGQVPIVALFGPTGRLHETPLGPQRVTPLVHLYCRQVVISGGTLSVEDTGPTENEVGAFLGFPLAINGLTFGALCVVDQRARTWPEEMKMALGDLARIIVTDIESTLLRARLQRAHDTLIQQNQTLEQVVERQNEFIGMAAHDMRTPLTVALAYSRLLERGAGQERDQRKMIQAISRSCYFMLELIDGMLDFEALKSGKLKMNLELTAGQPFVDGVVENHRLLAQDKGLELEFRCQPDSPELWLDRHKFEQALNNVLGNAIKYSQEAGRIVIELRHAAGGVTISVTDQGPGIAADRLANILQPFQRGEPHGRSGAGLGLAIVERIVREHGGQVRIDSQPGQGTEVVLTLPGRG